MTLSTGPPDLIINFNGHADGANRTAELHNLFRKCDTIKLCDALCALHARGWARLLAFLAGINQLVSPMLPSPSFALF